MLALAAQSAAAYDKNVDLKNTGTTTAYDVAVVLNGTETVTATFDGYTYGPLIGHFTQRTVTPLASGDTVIHWMNIDGIDAPIPPGKTIHVGWSTSDCTSQVKDMYWTTKAHGRLRNSVILDVRNNLTYTTGGFPIIDLTNVLEAQVNIRIRDVRFVVVDSPLPLEALSTMNDKLMAQLRPVSEGSFVLSPGKSARFEIPVAVKEGQSLLTVYTTSPDEAQGAVSSLQSAEATHFMQRPVVGGGGGCGGQIPNQ
ncbi:hypothetical protein [Corallococcus llansteffanensis]|nr:hypothetical protein [Corallococcus llansteffanensis]